ncbi:MAG: hypothetical protein K1V97_08955 [Lachnospiraceae bacterium]
MLYLIAFQLSEDELTHTGFYEALNHMGTNIRVFDGAYLLETGWTAYGVRKQLLPHIKPNDRLIITKMYTNDCAGRLPKDIRAFISRHITVLSVPKPIVQIIPPPENDILP